MSTEAAQFQSKRQQIQYGFYNTDYCFSMRKENVSSEPGKDTGRTAPKKYPRILGNVSKDKRQSIQGYLPK